MKKSIQRPNDVTKRTSQGKKLVNPGQTKSSLRRQQIALAKKLEHTSLVPDEALCRVFEYLNISDLLRCCCVNKSWKEVAEIPYLWQRLFRRLPKGCQDLSEKAKTTGCNDWKKECIECMKLRRGLKAKSIMGTNNLHSGKKKKAEATRTFGVRWMIEVKANGSCISRHFAEEDFISSFNTITARWNDLIEMEPLSKWKTISLYAVTPLVFDEKWRTVKDSICTRSLLFTHTFKGQPLKTVLLVKQDYEITLYSLNQLFFGVWSSSLPEDGDLAFIGYNVPIHNLLLKTQNGNSKKIWTVDRHQIVADDVDPTYGCHDYEFRLCLRNSRKQFHENIYEFYKNGVWDGEWLVFEQRSLDNPLYDDFYFDIKDKLQFSWKSTAVNGKMENLVILDGQLIDCNKEIFWNFSQPLRLIEIEDEPDFGNYGVFEINGEEENKTLSVRVVQDGESTKSTVLSLIIRLHKSSINRWFGTKY